MKNHKKLIENVHEKKHILTELLSICLEQEH